MRMGRLLAPFSLSVLAVVTAAAPAGAGTHGPHLRPQHAAKPTASNPLVDHGGKVLGSSTTYAIWWGSSGFPSDEQSAIPALLQGFGGSSYLATADQYVHGTATSSYIHDYPDPSAPPSHGPSVNAIVNEVSSVLSANHVTPDPNAIYFVFTSNFPKVNYCAWHSAGTIGSVTVQVAYVPNTTNVTGCAPRDGYTTAGNGLSQGTQSIADSTAHEFMEAVTDPVPTSGWADKNGQEIADKCETYYAAPVTLANSTTWQLQGEWSNATGGCVQTTP